MNEQVFDETLWEGKPATKPYHANLLLPQRPLDLTLPFSLHEFIVHSNLIDPQYDRAGNFLPGDHPGSPMYDRHMAAIGLFEKLRKKHPLPADLCRQLHRALTKGIDIYDDFRLSGRYRRSAVTIDGLSAPEPAVAKTIIEQELIPRLEEERYLKKDRSQALQLALWCHNTFECAHPFIDGNGRTGRLLLNFVLELFGHEKVVIPVECRKAYYAMIQEFREKEFSIVLAAVAKRK